VARPPTFVSRLLGIAFAASFLAAGTADAYGAHGCAHHDTLFGHASHSRSEMGGAGHGTSLGESHAAPGNHGDHDDAPAGPCTCVGDCHGGSATPVAFPEAPSVHVPPVWFTDRRAHGERRPVGRLTARYELHIPNAPPLT
jgi:hypothetical protein